jgi:spore maturation protein CgeB
VKLLGHVFSRHHNAFNVTPRAVLNINRDSMARTGFSPPTRVFEAAGAGACLLTDAWEGIECFLEPDREILVASDADQIVEHLERLTAERASEMGRAARRRVLTEHTYAHRARQFEALIEGRMATGVAA